MFNSATDDFTYRSETFPILANKATTIALRQVALRVYNKAFAGASYKRGLTNCIELAQILASKGVEECVVDALDFRLGAINRLIIVNADGKLGKDLELIKIPNATKNKLTRIDITFTRVGVVDLAKCGASAVVRYQDEYYRVEIA